MNFIFSLANKIATALQAGILFVGGKVPSRHFRGFLHRYTNKRTATALLVVVVFIGFGITRALLSAGDGSSAEQVQRQVQVAPAGLVSQLNAVLESTGEIKSQTQGDLRAQRTGVITQVNAKVGQFVRAGTIIAAIENASERASVAQAQAGVAQARANFNKVAGGPRDEQLAVLAATTASAQQALDESLVSAKNTLFSAYAASSAAFSGGVDEMFNGADTSNPRLVFISSNGAATVQAEHGRFLAQGIIDRHKKVLGDVTFFDRGKVRSEITSVEQELLKMKAMLDDLITALDSAAAGGQVTIVEIDGYKATASTARSSVLSTLSALSTARGSLNSADSALKIAQENEAQGVTGAQEEDVEVAQAQLTSAQASYAQAVAQLENTRVRAPVSGTITILTVNVGDFVTAFQDVGLVANEGALEVQAYISPSTVDRLAVGGQVLVDGEYEGVITSIAPGIDPTTRQVEVRIALVSGTVAIPNGARVSIEFLAAHIDETTKVDGPILIPIAALKLIGSDAFVFSVSSENKLVPHPVRLGPIVQSSVEILEGITRDTSIVLDARGLNEGDAVVIAN